MAWTSGDHRRLVRAYTLQNLVWLCQECHRSKTRRDLRELSEMRNAQVCLAGVLKNPAHPGMGTDHWALAEGGLVMNARREPGGRTTGVSQNTRRRIPFTLDPRETSCPRCLEALRHRGRGRNGALLGVHPDWTADPREGETPG